MFRFSLANWRGSVLLLFPIALTFRLFHLYPVATFAVAALALIPLASLLGDSTEELAGHVGPELGGFLNATLGNATELIFGILALRRGHTAVVQASLTGSIISNLLLVVGFSALLGGLGREKQTFNRTTVGASASMLFLAVVALVMPAVYDLAVLGWLQPAGETMQRLSLWTAAVLLISYFCSLVFNFKTHRNLFGGKRQEASKISQAAATIVLLGAGALIAVVSEILVDRIEAATSVLGWTELFVGIVVVAIVGNAAEHSTAILLARKDKMDLALGIAMGSSAQIALFVAPLLVLLSQARSIPMSLLFHPLEIAAVFFSVATVTLVSIDGETNWFEGVQLLGVYFILAVFFYFLPAPH